MQKLHVDGVLFSFDESWKIAKYDDWKFYKNRFQKIPDGRKAVDIIAISPDRDLFLVEVKDYRLHARTKPSDLHKEFSHKVIDTLAALVPLSLAVGYDEEREFARLALRCKKIRLVLHLEQSRMGSKVSPRKYKSEDIQLKMRQALKAIDVRPIVTEINHMQSVQWNCQ